MGVVEVVIEHALILVALLLAPIGIGVLVISGFERSRQGLVTGAALLAVSAVLLLRLGYAEFWLIDTCLDRGGGWNKATHACER